MHQNWLLKRVIPQKASTLCDEGAMASDSDLDGEDYYIVEDDNESASSEYVPCINYPNDKVYPDETNPQKGEINHDPLFLVRPMVDMMQRNFHTKYRPGKELSLDESTCPFKGRVHFKCYNPKKNKQVPY